MERDPETGNDHAWFRYLSSSQGRWLSPDPLGGDVTNPQSLNRYAYVLNNPTNLIDPLGLDSGDCVDFANPDGSIYTFCAVVGNVGALGAAGGSGTAECPSCIDLAFRPSFQPLQDNGPEPHLGVRPGSTPGTPPGQKPQEAATQGCEEEGQLAFNVPFTKIPVTVSASFTFLNANFSLNRDVSVVIPTAPIPSPFSFGLSVDININAPTGFAPTVNVGSGKNLSVGTFLTPNGPKGFTFSVGPSEGPVVSVSEPVTNLCGKSGG